MLKGKHIKTRGLWIFRYSLLGLLILGILIYPFLEPYLIRIEQYSIVNSDLAEDVRQLRIVFVTDLHANGFPWFSQGRAASLVSTINSLNADIVLLGGDFTDRTGYLTEFFSNLPDIHAKYGVWAVLGESDHHSPVDHELQQAMKGCGITLLDNQVANVRIGQQTIHLAGIDMLSESYDLDATAARVAKGDFTILLCHTPELIDDALRSEDRDGKAGWFDLGLFGHTHAGQLPFGLHLFHLSDEIPKQHHSGWFFENRIPMLVSPGIGTSRLPIRIGCPPTIHLITIRNR